MVLNPTCRDSAALSLCSSKKLVNLSSRSSSTRDSKAATFVSTEIVRKEILSPTYLFFNACRAGVSLRQGPHQLAQRSTNMYLPLCAAKTVSSAAFVLPSDNNSSFGNTGLLL